MQKCLYFFLSIHYPMLTKVHTTKPLYLHNNRTSKKKQLEKTGFVNQTGEKFVN